MTLELNSKPVNNIKSLYERDFNLWLEETAQLLKKGYLDQLDIENLLEEIQSMGRSEKRRVKSLLTRLFEHLLKLTYWKSERNYNEGHWRGEIRNFRKQIKDELKASPSLKPYLREIFQQCYQDAREITSDITKLPLETFPEETFTNLEQVLDESWLPN